MGFYGSSMTMIILGTYAEVFKSLKIKDENQSKMTIKVIWYVRLNVKSL